MEVHGLKISNFQNEAKAFEAADTLVASQRANPVFKDTAIKYPDQSIAGIKQLDTFYYFSHKGISYTPISISTWEFPASADTRLRNVI